MSEGCAATKSKSPGATVLKGAGYLKARLLKVIAAAEGDEVAAMLDQLWSSASFHVQRPPRTALVMCTARDPFETPFHLGEVLVSDAEVLLNGHRGYAVICGDVPERALLLAAVEAAEANTPTPNLEGIFDFIRELENRSAGQKMQLSKLAAATQVQFESMKKETVDFGSLGQEVNGDHG